LRLFAISIWPNWMTLDGVKDWASSSANLDKEVTPFGYAAAGCVMRNGWPGAAFLFINEIGERFGKNEGEWYELKVSAHLLEPNKFLAHKDILAGSHLGRIQMSFWEIELRPPKGIMVHCRNMRRASARWNPQNYARVSQRSYKEKYRPKAAFG
jgi:hypothetical protein